MKFIIGNWKMYPKTLKEAKAILAAHRRSARLLKRTKVVICAPQVFVGALATGLRKTTTFALGAQDVFWEDEGARTGETSPAMLASLGLQYVIVGHSERRALGETNKEVSQKAAQAMKHKLTAVLCVGEQVRDDAGEYFGLVRSQLHASLAEIPKNASAHLMIAYEPIWAIGSKALRPAAPADLHEMTILIRRELVAHFGKTAGFRVPILYGGSVDERNAEGFLTLGEADGLLIGRVSLSPEGFGAIVRLAEQKHS